MGSDKDPGRLKRKVLQSSAVSAVPSTLSWLGLFYHVKPAEQPGPNSWQKRGCEFCLCQALKTLKSLFLASLPTFPSAPDTLPLSLCFKGYRHSKHVEVLEILRGCASAAAVAGSDCPYVWCRKLRSRKVFRKTKAVTEAPSTKDHMNASQNLRKT